MKKLSYSKASKTDWPRIRAMSDRDVLITGEHPEASLKHIVRGIARRGLRPVDPKVSISLRLDADVLEWFKAQGRRPRRAIPRTICLRLASGCSPVIRTSR